MLVLTRKIGEKLVIDGGIVVQVTKLGSGFVKLAVDAPPSISVNREEIQAKINNEGANETKLIDDKYLISLLRKIKSDKPALANVQKEVQRLILS